MYSHTHFKRNLLKHNFIRNVSIGNGPKFTHFSSVILDVISLSDVISPFGPKVSETDTFK